MLNVGVEVLQTVTNTLSEADTERDFVDDVGTNGKTRLLGQDGSVARGIHNGSSLLENEGGGGGDERLDSSTNRDQRSCGLV